MRSPWNESGGSIHTFWTMLRYWWSPSFAVLWSFKSTQSSRCFFMISSKNLVHCFLLELMTLWSCSKANCFSRSPFPVALLISSKRKLIRNYNFNNIILTIDSFQNIFWLLGQRVSISIHQKMCGSKKISKNAPTDQHSRSSASKPQPLKLERCQTLRWLDLISLR